MTSPDVAFLLYLTFPSEEICAKFLVMKTTRICVAALSFLFLAFIFSSCKKGNGSEESKQDYSGMFNNKTWWGEHKVSAHNLVEPYTLHFNSDKTVTWNSAGSTNGKGVYTVDAANKKVKVDFPTYYMDGASFTADIISESELGNFVPAANQYYKLSSCKPIVPHPTLDNSAWVGTWDNLPCRLEFQPGSKVNVFTNNVLYRTAAPYSLDHGYIRINTGADRFFGVLSGNSLMGIYLYSQDFRSWNVTKQ
jgi:hypothetical protein